MRYALCAAAIVASMVMAAGGTNVDKWNDTPLTTNLWRVISTGDAEELKELLASDPEAANARSGDGRGALWWAYEYGKKDLIQQLIAAGASTTERDADGKTPAEVTSVGPTAAQQRQQEEGGVPSSGFDDEDDEDV
jgi:hypothetical protein